MAARAGLADGGVRNGQESRTVGVRCRAEAERGPEERALARARYGGLSLVFDLGFLVLDRSLDSSELSRSLVAA